MIDLITFNGYRLDQRRIFAEKAPDLLVQRAEQFSGQIVLWDENDDEDGFLLVGDSEADMRREFEAHFGDDLARPDERGSQPETSL
jgi:hypothetical protein